MAGEPVGGGPRVVTDLAARTGMAQISLVVSPTEGSFAEAGGDEGYDWAQLAAQAAAYQADGPASPTTEQPPPAPQPAPAPIQPLSPPIAPVAPALSAYASASGSSPDVFRRSLGALGSPHLAGSTSPRLSSPPSVGRPSLNRLPTRENITSPAMSASAFQAAAALTVPRNFTQFNVQSATTPRAPPAMSASLRAPNGAAPDASPSMAPFQPPQNPQTPAALALTPTDVNLPSYFSAKPGTSSLGTSLASGLPTGPIAARGAATSLGRDAKDDLRPQTLPRMRPQNQALLTTSQRYLTRYPLHPKMQQQYVIGEELGVGGFGFVVAGERRNPKEDVAIKFIFRNRIPAQGWARDPDLGVVPMEVYILKNVRHRNIVRFLDYIEDERFCILVEELHGTQWTKPDNPIHKQPAAPAAELSALSLKDKASALGAAQAAGEVPALRRTKSMDLFECIEQHNRLPEKEAKKVFKQVAEAVAYLHNKGVVHRDLKDENIVIDDAYHVKLIDFGSAAVEPRGNPNFLWDRFMGTVQFAAPEILKGEKYRGRPADVWALGVLLYTILFGENPFSGSEHAILGAPKKQPGAAVSPEAEHLVEALLAKEWRTRPTADQILQHPWLRDAEDPVPSGGGA
ncbi:kinase-like domain-containing protein [Hyaloraphidium curvatum]|nr:kinase-like domain-containing protein [Hyaloraphidium curvatum]